MRWAVHTHSPAIFTTLSAEDPQTPGERPFFDDSGGFAAAVRSLHYAPSLGKIRQPVLSTEASDAALYAREIVYRQRPASRGADFRETDTGECVWVTDAVMALET
jgi:hypothetical protein